MKAKSVVPPIPPAFLSAEQINVLTTPQTLLALTNHVPDVGSDISIDPPFSELKAMEARLLEERGPLQDRSRITFASLNEARMVALAEDEERDLRVMEWKRAPIDTPFLPSGTLHAQRLACMESPASSSSPGIHAARGGGDGDVKRPLSANATLLWPEIAVLSHALRPGKLRASICCPFPSISLSDSVLGMSRSREDEGKETCVTGMGGRCGENTSSCASPARVRWEAGRAEGGEDGLLLPHDRVSDGLDMGDIGERRYTESSKKGVEWKRKAFFSPFRLGGADARLDRLARWRQSRWMDRGEEEGGDEVGRGPGGEGGGGRKARGGVVDGGHASSNLRKRERVDASRFMKGNEDMAAREGGKEEGEGEGEEEGEVERMEVS